MENKDKCGYTLCKYYDECPHNDGVHYNVWGEGIECQDAKDRYEQMLKGDKEILPW